MPEQRVRKMLILGLGSTGTRICERLGQRLIEEFGGLERVPWIRFLCLETDHGAGNLMSERGDLVTLCISNQEYQGNLASPAALNGAIEFDTWADMPTLRNIGDIQTGAGNIRMAGRLAFLYPENFKNALIAFKDRYDELERLTEAAALEKRGALPGGDNPVVRFIGNQVGTDGAAQNDSITVAVVGSLCGGTSSGVAVDVGYFIERFAPRAQRLALFSLPRWDLNVATYPAADKLKTNAYTALRELYHFSQIGMNSYSVKYSTDNDRSVMNQCYPYSLILLGWPDAPSHDAEEALHQAMAERLFANAFCPEADPFVAGINAKGNEKYGNNQDRHTLFCTFGIGVLEFPAPRLVEYGAARLLSQTLRPWLDRKANDVATQADVTACSLDYDNLKAALLGAASGLEDLLQPRVAEVVENAKRNPSSFTLGLAQLQAGFGDRTGSAEHPNLPFGAVPQRLKGAQAACVDHAWDRVRRRVEEYLKDWQSGPEHALAFLGEVRDRLNAARNVLPALLSGDPGSPGSSARTLAEIEGDRLVWLVGLKGRAMNDAAELLQAELRQYMTARLERAVAEVMASGRDTQGLPMPGVLDALQDRIDVLMRRLHNLRSALTQYSEATRRYAETQRVPPAVKGHCLMMEETADRVYQDLLAPNGDPGAVLSAEQACGASLLGHFAGLAARLTEVGRPCELDSAPSPNAAREALLAADRQPLEAAARAPFQSLLSRNVFAEWGSSANRAGVANECAQAADLCLSPDAVLAKQMKGSDLDKINVLIQPNENSAEFDRLVGSGWAMHPGGGPTRAIFLREVYCIPPEALRGVTRTASQPQALETASFKGYYTFARKDISWGPMSEVEWQRLESCERLLAVAIQIQRARVVGGSLLIDDYPRQNMGDAPYRKLSACFPEAVRQWALLGRDNENLDLDQLEVTLAASIGGRILSLRGEQFVARLSESLDFTPPGVSGWDARQVGARLTEFCMADTVLNPYHQLLFAPPRNVLDAMSCKIGERQAAGRPVERAGYYCLNPGCGSLIGTSELEAARAGWRCPTCTADHSIHSPVPGDWVVNANNQKSLGGARPFAASSENGQQRERPADRVTV